MTCGPDTAPVPQSRICLVTVADRVPPLMTKVVHVRSAL